MNIRKRKFNTCLIISLVEENSVENIKMCSAVQQFEATVHRCSKKFQNS